jgi:hypothetical protein
LRFINKSVFVSHQSQTLQDNFERIYEIDEFFILALLTYEGSQYRVGV